MDKYRKIMKPKEKEVKDDKEIRCTAVGSVSAYVSRAAKVLNEMNEDFIIITGTGNAITKAVQLGEVVKRRIKGLHQITSISSTEIIDEYEPLEEGLDKVTDTRTLSTIEIKLSKKPLDTADTGYQPPIDESEVKEFTEEDLAKSRGRGRGRGKGRGKGKGKGKSKEKGKGKGKGKGKSKGKDAKGKGKGKGKSEKGKGKGKGKEDKGKGKGKDKGKGKGKDKGKDKGKSKGKGKEKGKSKGYDSWGGGYSSGYSSGYGYGSSKGWDDWGKSSSKGWGKGKSSSKGYGKGKGWY